MRELLATRTGKAGIRDDEPRRIGGHGLVQPGQHQPAEDDRPAACTAVLVGVDDPPQRPGLIADGMDLADATARAAAQLVGASATGAKALGADRTAARAGPA